MRKVRSILEDTLDESGDMTEAGSVGDAGRTVLVKGVAGTGLGIAVAIIAGGRFDGAKADAPNV